VHPGVGASGAGDAHPLAEQGSERVLDGLLHGSKPWLALPAPEGRAIIGKSQRKRPPFQSPPRGRSPLATV
jgi:hypothetical protein